MRMNSIKTLRRDTSGAAAVEFALIIPIFTVLFIGIVEFSLMLYTYNTFEHAARDVIRLLSTNRVSALTRSELEAKARDEIKKQLPIWVTNNYGAIVASLNNKDPVLLIETYRGDSSKNVFHLTISVPMQYTTPLTFLTGFLPDIYKNRTISAKVALPQERV